MEPMTFTSSKYCLKAAELAFDSRCAEVSIASMDVDHIQSLAPETSLTTEVPLSMMISYSSRCRSCSYPNSTETRDAPTIEVGGVGCC